MYKSLLVVSLFSLSASAMEQNKPEPKPTSNKGTIGAVAGGTLGAATHAAMISPYFPIITCTVGAPGWILLGAGTGAYTGYKYMNGSFSSPKNISKES